MSASAGGAWTESIPWLIAVVGWGFTHIFSEARERRKEVRSQLDKVIEQVLVLEKEGRLFHMSAGFEELKASNLTAGLDALERKMYRVSCLNIDSLLSRIIAFRRSISLSNFELSTFSQQAINSEIVGEISDAAAGLEDALECHYRERYPANFPFFRLRVQRRN